VRPASPPRVKVQSARLGRPAIAVHGGAGTFKVLAERGEEARVGLERALGAALEAGWLVLSAGGPAVLAAVESVASMEDSGHFNAGRGSVPTTAGTLETDACVMDGATRRAGAVCAATWPANPVRAALAVARLAGDPAPVLLAGAGADELAKNEGLAPMPARPSASAPAGSVPGAPAGPAGSGTVGAVAVDAAGHLAAATSTGGIAGQRAGRVGDSPIVGAGTWADDLTVAVSATGTGEAFLLAGFAHRVDWAVREGSGLEDAVAGALQKVFSFGGTGGAIALSGAGDLLVAFSTPAMARGWRASRTLSAEV